MHGPRKRLSSKTGGWCVIDGGNGRCRLKCDIVGRSRKQVVMVDRNFVVEKLTVKGKCLTYKQVIGRAMNEGNLFQVEGSFSQPNGHMCEKMLDWAIDSTAQLGGDLLELYCGAPLDRSGG